MVYQRLLSPCAERMMDRGTCQICLRTWHRTSSTSPVRRKLDSHSDSMTKGREREHTQNETGCGDKKETPRTYWIRHWNLCVWHQFDFAFAGQVHINDSVAVEANLQLLVRPEVMIFPVFIGLTNNTFRGMQTCVELESQPKTKWRFFLSGDHFALCLPALKPNVQIFWD